jgi:hypothetical protein
VRRLAAAFDVTRQHLVTQWRDTGVDDAFDVRQDDFPMEARLLDPKQSRLARSFDDMLARFVLDPGIDLETMLRAIDRAHDEMRGHGLIEVDRKKKAESLRTVDGAGAGQQHADHRREDRGRQHSLKDAPAELRFPRELLVDVKRVHIAGDLDEPSHVIFGEGFPEGDMLPDFEIFDSRNH